MTISAQKKALIHVAKSQLGMEDGDYRAMLRRIAGVESSTGLDEASFERVMGELERLGFRRPRSLIGARHREGMASAAQVGRIRALWKAYSARDDELALGRWLEKKFHVSNVRFLEGQRAGKCIAVLEKLAAWRKAHPLKDESAGGWG